MDKEDAALPVGFEIDFRDSFGQFRTLEDLIGEYRRSAHALWHWQVQSS